MGNDDNNVVESISSDKYPDLWNMNFNRDVDDHGVPLSKLKKRNYKSNKIMCSGPPDDLLYYEGLSRIVIDYIKVFYTPGSNKYSSWGKLPRNRTDAKNQMFKLLLSMRILVNEIYHLDQLNFLKCLETRWNVDVAKKRVLSDDRARLFGLVMTYEMFREYYEKLAVGVKRRDVLDSPEYKDQVIFQELAFAFNNEEFTVSYPDGWFDVKNHQNVDPNNMDRITIHRDCK